MGEPKTRETNVSNQEKDTMLKLLIPALAFSALLVSVSPGRAFAQSTPQPSSVRSPASVPDENTLSRLVWSTMIALDNANRTENYSVLHSLGTLRFKQKNPPAQLMQNFSSLRQNRVDLGRTILSPPTYYIPPAILSDGSLRLRGGFDYRLKSVRFDLIYANEGGGWRINALSIVETNASAPK